MPLDFKTEKIQIVTGSMLSTISSLATATPNGVLTEPSGSLVRTQDGRIWVNTTGGSVWHPMGPTKFDTIFSGSITGTLDLSLARNATIGGSFTGSLDAKFNRDLYVIGSITGSGDATFGRRVGIGVGASPSAILDVRTADNSVPTVRLQGTTTTTFASFDFYSSGGSQKASVGYGNSAVGLTHLRDANYLYTAGPNWLFADGTATRFVFDMTNYKLGINNATADYHLHVRADAGIKIQGINATDHNTIDYFDNTNTFKVGIGYAGTSASTVILRGNQYFWRGTSGVGTIWYDGWASAVAMRLWPGGNLNIGTFAANPNVKLNVEGAANISGSLTGSGDGRFDRDLTVTRNVSIGASLTASLDVAVGRDLAVTRNLNVTGSLTGTYNSRFGRDLYVGGAITGNLDALIQRVVKIQGDDQSSNATKTSLNVLAGFAASSSLPVNGIYSNVGGNYDTQAFYGYARGVSTMVKGIRTVGANPLINIGFDAEVSGSEADSVNVGFNNTLYGSGRNAGISTQVWGGSVNHGGAFSCYSSNNTLTAGAENYAVHASGSVKIIGNLYITGTIYGGGVGTGNVSTAGGTTNVLPRFSAASTLADSIYSQNAGATEATVNGDFGTVGYISAGGTLFGGGNLALAGNEIHFMRTTNGADTGYINYYGYSDSTGHFRDLIVADGKGATVATFAATDKSLTIAGRMNVAGTVTGSAPLKIVDNLTDRVPTVDYPASLYVFHTGTWNTAAGTMQPTAIHGVSAAGRTAGGNGTLNIGVKGEAINASSINIGVYGRATGSNTGAVNYGAYLIGTGGASSSKALLCEGSVSVTSGDISTDGYITGSGYFVNTQRARTLLAIRSYSTGSGGVTYTPTSGTKVIRLRMVGGGGGTAGTAGLASSIDVCGGGASGAYLEWWLDPGSNTSIAGGALVIGIGGIAGTAGGTVGGSGGNTAITIQGTTFTATGGGPGNRTGTGATNRQGSGGEGAAGSGASAAGTFASLSPLALSVTQGGYATRYSLSFAIGGIGGSNPLGTGGRGTEGGNSNGANGTGYGGGGGGSMSTTLNITGTAGTAGIIIIEEYG